MQRPNFAHMPLNRSTESEEEKCMQQPNVTHAPRDSLIAFPNEL
jgi:hypothetical protein